MHNTFGGGMLLYGILYCLSGNRWDLYDWQLCHLLVHITFREDQLDVRVVFPKVVDTVVLT